MKIKYFIIIAICIPLAVISALIIDNWNRHLIYLSSGDIIEADKAWVVFNEVYYEKGEGTLFTVKTNAVDEVVSANISSLHDWGIILSHAFDSREGIFGILMNKNNWFVCLAIFIGLGAIVGMRFISSKKSRIKDKDEDEELITIPISAQASDSEKIVLFFLNIYLRQLKAKRTDRYHYRQTDITGPLKTTVYEFRVNIDGQWQSRRMSLGRIGEDSGARSKCFYVIYDDHFVVKIPPEPLTDINVYIQSIQSDRQIADRLAPRECLVPKVSIVLKRIPSFVKLIGETASDNEQKCIDGLNERPGFKNFLNIGGKLAFFMDLSKYFFLGNILKECHDAEDEISKEIHQHQDLIFAPHAFADRYGADSTDLSFKLQNVCESFEKQFSAPAIASLQKKEWFAGVFLRDHDSSISSKIPGNALAILNVLKNERKEVSEEYKTLLRKYAQEKIFKQNISKIQSICSQLVELMSWLFSKNVAIRDLKPDNLLVAGDPSKYPHFLNSSDGFEIGLIDVEIALYLNPEYKKIEQPKIGWTPFYATPTHMLLNELLQQLYKDMSYIFFLQDWHAITAMIYQAVTGEKLFVKTAGTLVAFSRELPRHFADQTKMNLFAKQANEKFWQDAAREFEFKLKQKKALLTSVHLEIAGSAKKMFKAAAAHSRDEDVQNRLLEIKSGISAYDLMGSLFAHIKEVMSVN